jgi:hypothetical protein
MFVAGVARISRAASSADRRRMDGRAGGRSDAVGADAVVDDGVVVAVDDVVDHGGVVVNLPGLMVRDAMAVVVVPVEIIVGHKGEIIPC